ncbi:MAG TPA: PilN domain-containing protein, partial [Gaiellaceae bacterium]|nr:PilN domain-containing protein [Gaiellaceae bacterium]
GMRAVNLLPRDAERTSSGAGRVPAFVAGGGLAVVTVVAVMLSFSASGTASERKEELAALEQAIALVSPGGDPVVSQAGLVQERTDRVSALAAALTTRVPFDRLLVELAFVLPEDAWLTGIVAAVPVSTKSTPIPPGGTRPAPTSAAQGVTIQGATYSHESVARVLARLSVIPSLEDVRLTASARVEPQTASGSAASTTTTSKKKKQKVVVTFSIAATLRTGSES